MRTPVFVGLQQRPKAFRSSEFVDIPERRQLLLSHDWMRRLFRGLWVRSVSFVSTRHGRLAILTLVLIALGVLAAILDDLTTAIVFGGAVLAMLAVVTIDGHKKQSLVLRKVYGELSRRIATIQDLGDSLRRVDSRLGGFDGRLEGFEKRFTNVDKLLAGSNSRLSDLDSRLADVLLAQRDATNAHVAAREQLETRIDMTTRELHALAAGLIDVGSSLEKSLSANAERQATGLEAALELDRGEQLAEVDALLQVHRRVPLEGQVPLLGAWAIKPRGVLELLDLIENRRPRLIVECGSGSSTFYSAALLRSLDDEGRIVAIEHAGECAEATRIVLEAQGLGAHVEVLTAPLQTLDLEGDTYSWYDPSAVSDIDDIDLLVVDGPSRNTGPMARYPTFPMFRERLRPGAVILVDDARRSDQNQIIERWMSHGSLQRLRTASADQAVLQYTPLEQTGPTVVT